MLHDQLAYNDQRRPGYYVRSYRQELLQRTDKVQKIQLRRHTEPLKLEEMPTMVMKNFSLPREEIERLVEDSPNLRSQKVEAISNPPKFHSGKVRAVRPAMRMDDKNRLYLAVSNPFEDIATLAKLLVLQYNNLTGKDPAVIILPTVLSYMARPSDYFIFGDTHIPYIHDVIPGEIFDVAVRGADGDSWVL